tara:strand:- start:466 stop:1083 length:618 start_codon:yes stop_codon:yes gene_type:complete
VIKTILWDFDGVILDSMQIKGDGFVELFKNYNSKEVQILEKYHFANGGVSRFDKIKYFYNQVLKEEISEEKVIKLANTFSNIIKSKIYDKKKLINDSIKFIEKNSIKYNFHIISGSEHIELIRLCKYLEIDKYFISINGSPTKKEVLVKTVIKDFSYNKNEVILIGDAMTDYDAAKKNDIGFYGYNNTELKKYTNYIVKFKDFKI